MHSRYSRLFLNILPVFLIAIFFCSKSLAMNPCETSCSYYVKQNGAIFYRNCHRQLVPVDADIKTFKELPSTCGGPYFAVDKNHAYCGEKILEGVDPASFESIRDVYAKDKSHVYSHFSFSCSVVGEAEPASFEPFKAPPSWDGSSPLYFKDASHVFYEGRMLPGAKVKSFKFLVDDFIAIGMDDEHVFYRDKLIAGVNSGDVKLIPHPPQYLTSYWTDGKHVYDRGELLQNADLPTFKIDDEKTASSMAYVADDKDHYYIPGEKDGAEIIMDKSRCSLIGRDFLKCDDSLYDHGKKFTYADAPSFHFVGLLSLTEDCKPIRGFAIYEDVQHIYFVGNSDINNMPPAKNAPQVSSLTPQFKQYLCDHMNDR